MSLTREQLRRVPTIRSASRPVFGEAEASRAENAAAEGVLHGYFCRFGEWNPIDSMWEGSFLERVDPAAFNRTLNGGRGARAVCLFNHGHDPTMGDQALGKPSLIEPRDEGPYYEVPLFSGVPDLIVEGLRSGAYGASYRFRVRDDQWADPDEPTDHNPGMLPERTIHEVELYEFGPVTFPADPNATAMLRGYDLDDDIAAALNDLRTSPADSGTDPANTPAEGSPDEGTPTRHTNREQAHARLLQLRKAA